MVDDRCTVVPGNDPLPTHRRVWHCRRVRPDRLVDEYASRQYGAFSLYQARRAGMSDTMIQRRLESGAWLRVVPRVYVLASSPPRWERQIAVALLSRHAAIVSGHTAAVLHGYEGFRPGRPEIMVPEGANVRSPIARVTRSRWFHDIALTRVAGFRVATEAETLLVLSGRLPVDRLEVLLDDRLTAHAVAVDDFEPIRRRVSGGRVRGSGRLFPLLDERAVDAWEPSGNELERYLDRLTEDPRIPPTSRQHRFRFTEREAVVDRFIPAWRLILEADGRRWHTRRADFERDRARDNAAAAQGLAVLRFTWRMLTEDLDGCRRTLLETGVARARIA